MWFLLGFCFLTLIRGKIRGKTQKKPLIRGAYSIRPKFNNFQLIRGCSNYKKDNYALIFFNRIYRSLFPFLPGGLMRQTHLYQTSSHLQKLPINKFEPVCAFSSLHIYIMRS